MVAATTSGTGRMTREDWEAAALEAIESGGLGAIAVEPLARRLGVTKGSFYWHFADREELLRAALRRWEQVHTTDVLAELAAVADPAERLRRLFLHSATMRPSVFVQLLAAADQPLVQRALRRATKRRLDFLAAAYRELGLGEQDAANRALLAYSAYVGLAHLRRDAPERLRRKAALEAYVAHLTETLIPGR